MLRLYIRQLIFRNPLRAEYSVQRQDTCYWVSANSSSQNRSGIRIVNFRTAHTRQVASLVETTPPKDETRSME